jgi:serine/threonine-protein kinase
MSPEQALGKPIDCRSDIFSCGIVLYQLMTGRLPFRGDSEFSVLHAIVHDAPRPPSAIRPDFPTGLYPVIDRALAKDPGDRFQDALQMQMALDQFLIEEKAVSNTTLVGQYVRSLFHDLFEAQSRASPEDTASIEEMLAGLAIAQDSDPGSTALVETTPSKVRAASAVLRVDGDDVPVGSTGAVEDDDGIPIHTPSMVAPAPQRRSRLWVPLLLVAVFLSAIGGAILGARLLDDPGEGAKDDQPVVAPGPGTAPDAGQVAEDAAPEDPARADAGVATARPLDGADKKKPSSRRRKLVRKKKRKKKKTDVARVEPAGEGFLTLDTRPWTEVYFKGKRLGLTPLAYKKLPAGRHKLTLRNREKNIRRTIWIEIQPDQTTTKNLDLTR